LMGSKKIVVLTLFFLFAILAAGGCSKKVQPAAAPPGPEKAGVRTIAVMPVENKTDDKVVASYFREAVANELYMKGYPKVPFTFIDNKVPPGKQAKELSPKTAGESIGVDAVLYPVLEEVKTSYRMVRASTTVSAALVLVNAKTGETLLKKGHKVSIANYDLTKRRLQMKSCQELEPAFQEIAQSVLKTFPDGPEYMGKPPVKNTWEWF